MIPAMRLLVPLAVIVLLAPKLLLADAPIGKGLAEAMQASLEQALAAGVDPIPSSIRERLAPHFSAAVLDRVRHTTDWNVLTPDLIGLIPGLERARAMAVGHVVVFRGREAAADLGSWAREIQHVVQAERWGIDGLAARFDRDPRGVMAEVLAKARAVTGAGGRTACRSAVGTCPVSQSATPGQPCACRTGQGYRAPGRVVRY